MCLIASCPAPGKPAFEMMVYEHGSPTGAQFFLRVDGRRFDFTLPPAGANDLFRWPMQKDFAAALTKGNQVEVHFDPMGLPHVASLRGSSKAITPILARCNGTQAAAPAGRLTGLSPETDCQAATSTGTVLDRDISGGNLTGFRFKDQHGEEFVNVDPPRNSPALQAQLAQLIAPGAQVQVELHGCGAGAGMVVLSAVQAAR